MNIGLDWDDTITAYPEAFKIVSGQFKRVYIITINNYLTCAEAETVLGRDIEEVLICPKNRTFSGESHIWKAEMCKQHNIPLMMDDDPDVIEECRKNGIHAILIG